MNNKDKKILGYAKRDIKEGEYMTICCTARGIFSSDDIDIISDGQTYFKDLLDAFWMDNELTMKIENGNLVIVKDE